MSLDHFPLSSKWQSAAGPKFNYKLAWFERLIAHAAKLRTAGCRRSGRRLQRRADGSGHLSNQIFRCNALIQPESASPLREC